MLFVPQRFCIIIRELQIDASQERIAMRLCKRAAFLFSPREVTLMIVAGHFIPLLAGINASEPSWSPPAPEALFWINNYRILDA